MFSNKVGEIRDKDLIWFIWYGLVGLQVKRECCFFVYPSSFLALGALYTSSKLLCALL